MLKKLSPYKKNSIIYLLIIAVGIYLDQLSKSLVVELLKPIRDLPLIEGVFHFTYSENRGAAFGILSNNRWVFMLFSSVMIVALSVYLFYPKRQSTQLFAIGTALVISGGIGNMIDRVALGYVVDFLNFELINFAIFNVADSFVCVGAGLMVLSLLIDIIKEVGEKKK
ncbi:MAG: signal peptidase II [Clostridia bacterium]|nr:signal peptidase II [Clostridia bacterium]